jgi:hypothetical protein
MDEKKKRAEISEKKGVSQMYIANFRGTYTLIGVDGA